MRRPPEESTSILFVCLGNICRSPTAEGVMRKLVTERGLTGRVRTDSAGTGGWHVGESPDARAAAAARLRGVTLSGTARQVTSEDFREFDLLAAMDRSNRRELIRLAPDRQAVEKVRLLREFDTSVDDGDLEVPDPYYGGPEGFEMVLEMVQRSCIGLLSHLGLSEESGA